MNKILLLLALTAFAAPALRAQSFEAEETDEIEQAGTEVHVDSTLLGRDIFSTLSERVVVRMSPAVRSALNRQVEANAGKNISGFRIRIFFASNRTAREESSAAIRRFHEMYPHVEAFRTFDSPNFKVTAGSFRTRLDAEAFLREIKGDFPDAFIVRERFKYPTLGRPDTRPDDLLLDF
ncbi:MAG: hypothetical protein K6E35_01290 [Bacteroidales bacterium]|nr:hypothetical protein [Bacteroidales bacterium]